jgi:hypothetical protein
VQNTYCKDTLEPKVLATKLASVWHGTGMNTIVLSESATFTELFPTHITLMWFDSCMKCGMFTEQSGCLEPETQLIKKHFVS